MPLATPFVPPFIQTKGDGFQSIFTVRFNLGGWMSILKYLRIVNSIIELQLTSLVILPTKMIQLAMFLIHDLHLIWASSNLILFLANQISKKGKLNASIKMTWIWADHHLSKTFQQSERLEMMKFRWKLLGIQYKIFKENSQLKNRWSQFSTC